MIPAGRAAAPAAVLALGLAGTVAMAAGSHPGIAWLGGLALTVAGLAQVFARRTSGQQSMQAADAVVDAARRLDRRDAADVPAPAGLDAAIACLQAAIDAAQAAEQAASLASERTDLALGELSIGVMLTDEQEAIVFVNDVLKNALLACEPEIRATRPGFDARSLVGCHPRVLLDDVDLSRHNVTGADLGHETFKLTVIPLCRQDDTRVGTAIVWAQRTEERAFERDMQQLLRNALQGDLSSRIDLSQQTGTTRRLAESVNELVALAERITVDTQRVFAAMARGVLDETIDADYEGSFGRLKEDANSTAERLRSVVTSIQEASQAVSTTFGEVTESNTHLGERTEQQASSLQQAAAAIRQMTATVRNNAENARHANELAMAACRQAEKGGDVIGKTASAMAEIEGASKRIADITRVIDEIAFQTNLLALNASVEAARAGEQGRGFAVVASEVRSLAGRSAEAAKEIKSLIDDSVDKVHRGSSLVGESGDTLDSIVASVQQVNEKVADIANASQEQATGIGQINTTIGQMDDMTQQNAALVEQLTAASSLALDQVERLHEVISFFSAHGNAATPAPVDALPAPAANEDADVEDPGDAAFAPALMGARSSA